MQEIGIDISGNKTKSVHDMIKSGEAFSRVITVCDETSAECCPILPGVAAPVHWGFPDPSSFQGSHAEKLGKTREVRDTIKRRIEQWCAETCAGVSR
ncbi:MAG: low molecular weight phosphotyrosine protein phosphatase [Verrucomicrobiales bacterium]|nr:low molecular weight phosphotyrosine protein phosphatase [Verrucomicrobiales bacterium]